MKNLKYLLLDFQDVTRIDCHTRKGFVDLFKSLSKRNNQMDAIIISGMNDSMRDSLVSSYDLSSELDLVHFVFDLNKGILIISHELFTLLEMRKKSETLIN